MRKLIVYLFCSLVTSISCAQEFNGSVAYHYLYPVQWDKAIQTYNFSRPFLEEKQPLFKHGIHSSLAYLFKSERKMKVGIQLAYSYFGSRASNDNYKNTLNLNLLELACVLRFQNTEKWVSPYMDIKISAIGSALYRRVNGESFEVDDSKSKALGIGANLDLKLGYCLKLNERSSIAPFVSFHSSPYLFSPKIESVINQTQGMLEKSFTSIFGLRIGATYHFTKK